MDNQVTRSEWAGLSEVVRLTPGEHTLKLIVDPHNLIDASDETNNNYEVTFMWGGGEVPVLQLPRPSPPPDLPDPPLLPNLVPCLRFGSDGALIVSNRQDTFKDSQLIVSEPVYIDVVVRNESSVDLASSYEVLLFFDDQLVETLGAKKRDSCRFDSVVARLGRPDRRSGVRGRLSFAEDRDWSFEPCHRIG